MEYARRFRALLADLGLTYPDAAQLLHVSIRTLHNWTNGTHAVPYAVTKMLRLLRHMELPGKAWAGWHFSRGCLVTPEGRTIAAHESSWWSMMVLRAQSFSKLYNERNPVASARDSGYSEPCKPLSTPPAPPAARNVPHGNHGDNLPSNVGVWGQDGATLLPCDLTWPSIFDLPLNSTPLPVATASGSESPLTASSALPLTPIYNGPRLSVPLYRLHLQQHQPLPLSLPAQCGKSQHLPPLSGPLQSPSPSSRPNPRKPNAPSLQSGTGSKPPASKRQRGAA